MFIRIADALTAALAAMAQAHNASPQQAQGTELASDFEALLFKRVTGQD